MSFCLSKALGAPAGSVLVGPADVIRTAHGLRKMVGGASLQSSTLPPPSLPQCMLAPACVVMKLHAQ